jgi:cobyrinic acid a,c-diamide synthase
MLLDAPVILIVDAKAASESIAAVILGFKNYDPRVKIKGVILNNIHGGEFYGNIKRLVFERTGIHCVGHMSRMNMPKLDERHLGLVPVEELSDLDEYLNSLADMASKTIDIDAIEKIADENDIDVNGDTPVIPNKIGTGYKIAIASDKAFSFYYEDNLSLMKDIGIELVPFSPLNDRKIPEGVNGLYIGGGFPEVFSQELSDNKLMLEGLRERLEAGLPCYAECGGLMYLTKFIKDMSGKEHGMSGFFNAGSVMTERLQRFGYVDVGYEGVVTKAHEFHYSTLEYEDINNFEFKFKVRKAFGEKEWVCGLSRKNVLAGYAHVHFYSNFAFFKKVMKLLGQELS